MVEFSVLKWNKDNIVAKTANQNTLLVGLVGLFYWWRKPLLQVTDKLTRYNIMWSKFVSGLRQVSGFYRYSTNKTDRLDITEILLKVALNITLTMQYLKYDQKV